MPASHSWIPSGASSTASGPPRRLAGELLPAGVVEALPVGADAGAWGAVAIAQVAIAQQAIHGASAARTAAAVEGGA